MWDGRFDYGDLGDVFLVYCDVYRWEIKEGVYDHVSGGVVWDLNDRPNEVVFKVNSADSSLCFNCKCTVAVVGYAL